MLTGKIRARYKNGVIEPLQKLNLPEGLELEIEFKSVPSVVSELSKEDKRALIRQLRGSAKGLWGTTVEEVDAHIQLLRAEWE